jgi:hypothetical protein
MVHSRRAIVARGLSFGFHIPAEAFDVGAAGGEQLQPVLCAPGSVLT